MTKQCIYTEFGKEFSKIYPNNSLDLFNCKKQIEKLTKDLEISKENLFKKSDQIIKVIQKDMLCRKHIKKFVMCKNYSETIFGRSEYIFFEIVCPNVLESLNLNMGESSKLLKMISFKLSERIENAYTNCFPEISLLQDIMEKNCQQKDHLVLSAPNDCEFQYQQIIYNVHKFTKVSLGEKERAQELSLQLPTKKTNKQKMKRGIMANFTHYLDSRLNF